MSSRIASVFSAGRKVFIPFLMAGDPDATATVRLMHGLVQAGADILELGMPFSEPMADGKVIEAAGQRALAAGMTLAGVLEIIRHFRAQNTHTPLVLMGYYNPIYHYGAERFCRDAAMAGVDGLIIVDLPPEEEAELVPFLTPLPLGEVAERSDAGEGVLPSPGSLHSPTSPGGRGSVALDLIRLIAPTTPPARQALIAAHASGFVYYISVKGITGSQTAEETSLVEAVAALRSRSNLPIAAGFGIKTPQHAATAAKAADAVVVGSALVECLHAQGEAVMLQLAGSLADAVHG